MRQQLNENRTVQAVIIGVLLVAGAVMLMSQMGGKGGEAPTATTASTTVTGSDGTTADVTASTDGASATYSATVTPATGTTAGVPAAPVAAPLGAFEPGPGLPRQFVSAHAGGNTVVLYVYDPKGIEDRKVLAAVHGLEGDPNLAVFTVPDNDVADYSQVTQGVGVSQVPALIVVAPGGSGNPKATVSYGFRGSESVEQAVRDAVYKGKTLGYDPG